MATLTSRGRRPAFFASLLLVLCAAVAATAETDAQREVARLDQEVVEAVQRGDLAFLERTLAEDYVYVGPDGRARTRAESLADLRAGTLKFDAITVDRRQVVVHGDTAVVTGRERMRGRSATGAFDTTVSFVAIYVRRQGRWQEVLFQATPLRAP